MPGWRNW